MMRSLKGRIDSWLFAKNGEKFCRYFNFLNQFYWKYPIVLRWSGQHQKLLVVDGDKQVFIARPRRRAEEDSDGITAKFHALTDEYLLRRIDFHDGAWIFGCGAIVGEDGMCLKLIHRNVTIGSVDRETAEAACCARNVYGVEMNYPEGSEVRVRRASPYFEESKWR